MGVTVKFHQMTLHKMKQFSAATKMTNSTTWILQRIVPGGCATGAASNLVYQLIMYGFAMITKTCTVKKMVTNMRIKMANTIYFCIFCK